MTTSAIYLLILTILLQNAMRLLLDCKGQSGWYRDTVRSVLEGSFRHTQECMSYEFAFAVIDNVTLAIRRQMYNSCEYTGLDSEHHSRY